MKNDPANSKAASPLDWWLDVATGDLAAPGKYRIRAEIEGHFAEATKAHMAAGLPETEAQIQALRDMGEPKAAAKNFKRSCLTIDDAKAIAHSQRWIMNGRVLGWYYFLWAVFFAVIFLARNWDGHGDILFWQCYWQIQLHPIAAAVFVLASLQPAALFAAVHFGCLKRRSIPTLLAGFMGHPLLGVLIACLVKLVEWDAPVFWFFVLGALWNVGSALRCAFKVHSISRHATT